MFDSGIEVGLVSWHRVRVRASSGRGTSTFLRSFLLGFTGLGWCYVGSCWETKARDARASKRYWGQLMFSSACGEVFISAS